MQHFIKQLKFSMVGVPNTPIKFKALGTLNLKLLKPPVLSSITSAFILLLVSLLLTCTIEYIL
jgi:putative flippase GtrA